MVVYFQVISECIIRWWNWLHTEKEADSVNGEITCFLMETGNEEGVQ